MLFKRDLHGQTQRVEVILAAGQSVAHCSILVDTPAD